MTVSTALALACVIAGIILAVVDAVRPHRYVLPVAVVLIGVGVLLGAPAVLHF